MKNRFPPALVRPTAVSDGRLLRAGALREDDGLALALLVRLLHAGAVDFPVRCDPFVLDTRAGLALREPLVAWPEPLPLLVCLAVREPLAGRLEPLPLPVCLVLREPLVVWLEPLPLPACFPLPLFAAVHCGFAAVREPF